MVLKKSNSSLNSGATQRGVTHAGINKLNHLGFIHSYPPHILNVENYLMVTTDINMSQQEARDSLRTCLEEMYSYLGFDLPDLSHTINQNIRRRNIIQNSAKFINECSLNKNNTWLLPERITQMQADVDFLRSLTRNLHVRFHEVMDFMITTSSINSHKTTRTKTTAASEIVAKSSDSLKHSPRNEPVRPKRKQTHHDRGVQRSHLFSRKQKNGHQTQHSQENETEEKMGHLDVYLFAPCRIEARSAYYRMEKKFARRSNTSRLKSSTKMNGRSKGRFPCRKGYSNLDLAVDTMNGIKEVYGDNTDPTVFEDDEEVYTNEAQKSLEMKCDITDFITVRRRRFRKDKRDTRKRTTRDEEDVDGCALLCNQTRHPKGSFVLISQDEVGFDDVNHEGMTSCLHQQHNSDNGQNEAWSAKEVAVEARTTEKTNTRRAFELEDIEDFNRGFVMVNLEFSEEEEKLFSLSQEQRDTELLVEDKYHVKCGSSYPECFVVDCSPEKMNTSFHHWRVIIGRRRESGSELWLVSIQDQWQTTTQTKQHLQNCITHYKNARFSLRELIDIATALNSREITTQTSGTSKHVKQEWLTSNCVWRTMPLNIFTTTESCTVEETANKFKELIIDRNINRKQTILVESADEPHLTQCGVCFMEFDYSDSARSPVVLLPCSHTYCVCCWRAHLQHCIRNGANRITCMSTNCINLMDMTTISTILPYTLVQQWQAQVIKRRVDSSPYCQWCPNVHCNQIAVSRKETLKKQFGKVITCVCQQSWCSGCQGDPHWPASCDQMAAYRKLLRKTDQNLTVSVVTTFQVEVKPCPGCQYPIEKNEGCPSMLCSLCKHGFCWKCLEPYHYSEPCNQTTVETTTHFLKNKLEMTGPLNWYPHCLMLNRKIASVEKMKPLLHTLHIKATSSLLLSLPVYLTDQAAQIARLRAEECVLFLKQAYTLQESMHVLIGFAGLRQCCKSKYFVKLALSKMPRLDFITWRLKETVSKKSVSHLCKIDTITTHLLRAGRNVMRELSVLIPDLQHLSKDIETSSIGELNPGHLIRHK